ncbi:MAG: hypothetical protein U1G07_14330 [Verrucomicrobiota bacterium]
MRLPRNLKIFRGQLDVAPFAGVTFLLPLYRPAIQLVFTPGIVLDLPRVTLICLGPPMRPWLWRWIRGDNLLSKTDRPHPAATPAGLKSPSSTVGSRS